MIPSSNVVIPSSKAIEDRSSHSNASSTLRSPSRTWAITPIVSLEAARETLERVVVSLEEAIERLEEGFVTFDEAQTSLEAGIESLAPPME